jgi:inorganic pyrophosphatase
VLHELPYYVYLWAALNDVKNDMETAKRLYAMFLEHQAEFKPGIVDKCIINFLELEHWYDVEKAIREARKAISQ